MSNATSEQIGGSVFEGILMDTSGQPIFANWTGAAYLGLIEIDSPSLDAPAEVTGAGVANLDLEGRRLSDRGKRLQRTRPKLQQLLGGLCAGGLPNPGERRRRVRAVQAQLSSPAESAEFLHRAASASTELDCIFRGQSHWDALLRSGGALPGTEPSRVGPPGNSVTPTGGNGTIVSTWSAVPGATSYDVWDLTRGLPLSCTGLTALTCTDNGGSLEASSNPPNAPSDGCPAVTPSGLFNCGGPAATENQTASTATNFGTAIGSTNVIASVLATGVYNVGGSAYVSTAGVGCSSATNAATVTWAWTDATGTSQTVTGPLVSVTGNSALGATTVSGPLSIVAEAGTALSYSVTSTLGSTGCSTTPKYTVQLKALN